ncbi:MAG: PKD domain-containing protein [Ignavibacteriales bacterium]|nr:PKD domain-containing protein [Ignavibacteriales bacterium]
MKYLASLFLVLLLLFGCKKDDSNPTSPDTPSGNNGNINIGTVVDITTQTIGTGGGTITVNKPNDPLNGLTVTIQPNSFTQAQTIKISSAPITSHQLGQYFNPLTPMIKITYQGGFSDKTMRIKVPITLSAGKFAMGFFYNEQTGKLEGIPIEELASDHITIATKYFSPNTNQSLGKRTSTDIVGDLVVGFIDESVLTSQTIIDTGFKPGVDDWEFINYGSYIEPDGICAGMSLTAMWYYLERKSTDGTLFHKYDLFNDKTQPGKLWQDNPKGYRFASAIQSDLNWDARATEKLFQQGDPVLTWKAFALSMLLTKEPQYVGLRSTTNIGHAVVAYQMNYQTGDLQVSDPNYPAGYQKNGTTIGRTIKFIGNKFNPFSASLNADAGALVFDTVYYFGKTTMINWDKFRTRWTEVSAGTIGNDKFPTYKLYIGKVGGNELADNYILNSDTLTVLCRSTDNTEYLLGTDFLQLFYIFDQNGNQLVRAGSTTKGVAKIKLGLGTTKLGFYICGAKNGKAENYVDFKWINVNRLGMTIDPNPLNGDINKEYTFTANVQGTPPTNANKYVWNFGDGSQDVTVTGNNTAKHTFTTSGSFTVSVKLFDNTTNNVVISAASTVNILSSFTYEILATQTVQITLTGVVVYDKYYPNSTINYYYQNPIINKDYGRNTQTISWSGLSFSINYTYKFPPFEGYTGQDTLTASGTINGSISQDGKTISNITAHEKVTHAINQAYTDLTIVIHDIPYIVKTTIGCATCVNYLDYFYSASSSVQSKIASLQMTEKRYDSTTGLYTTMSSISYNMSYIYVDLLKKL